MYREIQKLVNLSQCVINTANDAFIVIDTDNTIILWSKKAEKIFGWTQEEVLNKKLHDFIIPNRSQDNNRNYNIFGLKNAKNLLENAIQINTLHKEGHEFPIEITINSIVVDGEIYYSASIRDNKEQLIYENSLRQQVALLNLSRDCIFVLNLQNIIIFWNTGAELLYGYKAQEVIGKPLSLFIKTEQPLPLSEIQQIMLNKKYWEGEVIHHKKNGEKITMLSRWTLEINEHGQPTRVLVTNTDISESKAYQKHIHYLATHDALTGLANRSLLEDRIQHAIDQARRTNGVVATMFMDLNRFKNVNDSLGHDKGDLLLKEIALRLTSMMGKGDTIARLGGDEFVVVLENIAKLEDVVGIAERVLQTIEKPILLGLQEVSVSASIGISMYPKDGCDYTSLMKLADVAMYRAKERGSGHYLFYSPDMNTKIFDQLLIESALYGAVDRKEFVVHYQPRIETSSKKLVGVEALVRWQHPDKGLIAPNDFIPLAEEIGLISVIGEWVLKESCRQNKMWQDIGFPNVKVSVNLSAHQLGSPNIVETIDNALKESGLHPDWLELEITESSLMKNIDVVKENLINIRRLGVCISIDDFGTGYSSLAYLKKLPIDTIKIDRSFINDLGHDQDDDAIVTATIAMAHSMNMQVVAEGVTSSLQVDFLINKGCDEMQGFLFSEAYPPKEIQESMNKNTWF